MILDEQTHLTFCFIQLGRMRGVVGPPRPLGETGDNFFLFCVAFVALEGGGNEGCASFHWS